MLLSARCHLKTLNVSYGGGDAPRIVMQLKRIEFRQRPTERVKNLRSRESCNLGSSSSG